MTIHNRIETLLCQALISFTLSKSANVQFERHPKGAEWIWKHIPLLLSRVGCPKETYQLLDFYHVTEHLQIFAAAAFNQESERKDWFKKARNIFRRNFAFNLIVEMNQLIFTAIPERAKTLITSRSASSPNISVVIYLRLYPSQYK